MLETRPLGPLRYKLQLERTLRTIENLLSAHHTNISSLVAKHRLYIFSANNAQTRPTQRVGSLLRYLPYEEEFFLFVYLFVHLDPAGTSGTKLCMASSFIQRKVEGYVWIQIFDPR